METLRFTLKGGGPMDIVVGAVLLATGLALCTRGALRMRHTFPAWAAVSAALIGAGLVETTGEHRFLQSPVSIVAAVVAAAAVGAACYSFYEVTVLVVPTTMGIAIAAVVMVAFNMRWSWITAGIGALVGLLLGSFAIISSLHRSVLTALSALCGATFAVVGVMLLAGSIDVADLAHADTTQRVASNLWWLVGGLALALLGAAVQVIKGERHRVTMRDRWVDAEGLQLRAT